MLAPSVEPGDLVADCPVCGESMWAMRSGQWTLKSAILKLVGSRMMARCPRGGCRGEAMIPWLQIDGLEARPVRRVLVRKP